MLVIFFLVVSVYVIQPSRVEQELYSQDEKVIFVLLFVMSISVFENKFYIPRLYPICNTQTLKMQKKALLWKMSINLGYIGVNIL